MDSVVHKDHSDTLLCQRIKILPLTRDTTYAISKDENGIRIIKNRLILRPIFPYNDRLHIETTFIIQRLCKKHATGPKFMLSRCVAATTRNQHNFLFRRPLFLG